jgi:hypothetical protein
MHFEALNVIRVLVRDDRLEKRPASPSRDSPSDCP